MLGFSDLPEHSKNSKALQQNDGNIYTFTVYNKVICQCQNNEGEIMFVTVVKTD